MEKSAQDLLGLFASHGFQKFLTPSRTSPNNSVTLEQLVQNVSGDTCPECWNIPPNVILAGANGKTSRSHHVIDIVGVAVKGIHLPKPTPESHMRSEGDPVNHGQWPVSSYQASSRVIIVLSRASVIKTGSVKKPTMGDVMKDIVRSAELAGPTQDVVLWVMTNHIMPSNTAKHAAVFDQHVFGLSDDVDDEADNEIVTVNEKCCRIYITHPILHLVSESTRRAMGKRGVRDRAPNYIELPTSATHFYRMLNGDALPMVQLRMAGGGTVSIASPNPKTWPTVHKISRKSCARHQWSYSIHDMIRERYVESHDSQDHKVSEPNASALDVIKSRVHEHYDMVLHCGDRLSWIQNHDPHNRVCKKCGKIKTTVLDYTRRRADEQAASVVVCGCN
jgi:hypothetical protein